jgi:hypothetical protein
VPVLIAGTRGYRSRLPNSMSAFEGIVLQKSKVAGLKIFRENAKQRAIADSYDLNRVTEVASEF